MLKFSLVSKHFVPLCFSALATSLPFTSGCSLATVRSFADYSEYAILPADTDDAKDVKWADYLKKHFQKRSTDVDCVIHAKAQDDSQLQVLVDFDSSLKTDYKVDRTNEYLHLTARTSEAMIWLLYQFMSAASESDRRFTSIDLPPSVISCRQDTAGIFAFEYRGIYSPSNSDADVLPILGTHNVDFDWGLWGHNLRKVFTDGGIPETSKALVDGKRSDKQFCFSSDALFTAYENYIVDNYGDGNSDETVRFAVMPNDNAEVCLCDACRKAGNTSTSATPAVTNMVERLAHRFPKHQFFTSSYSTTASAPARQLPSNVGVLVSAMALPLTADVEKKSGRTAFENTVNAWKRATNRIYVWDYMRNFDDYLTPYPCLHLLQSHLRYFHSLGVKGVFFNGSGYDYASFDDVQTYALAHLLRNPEANVDELCKRFFEKHYPTTHSLINDYYHTIEQHATQHTLSPYSGIGDLKAAYLDAAAFELFWNKLDRASKQSANDERKQLNKLLTALNFTRLELYRLQKMPPSRSQLSQTLGLLDGYKSFKDLANYREANGELSVYVSQWASSYPWIGRREGNVLLSHPLKAKCRLDEGYTDLNVLTDGKRAFTTDYHTGWVVSAASPFNVEVSTALSSQCMFRLSFLHAPLWRIYAPSAVEVWQNGKLKGKASVSLPAGDFVRTETSVLVSSIVSGQPVEVRVYQSAHKGKVTMACDEIEVFAK